ncbi:MAG: SLC13 family permease [Gemmatimonadaceae bacterium]
MIHPIGPLFLAAVEAQRAPTTDLVSQVIVAAVLLLVFALLVRDTAHRVLIAMASVAVLWGITYFTPFHLSTFEWALRAIDLNVIVLLSAMMALVGVMKTTGVFESLISRILLRSRGRPFAALSLIVWFTAAASALLDNVTTVIFVTPMAIGVARRMKLPPQALLLPMVMASNIGGTATLIGDPPNIMIGSGASLSFVDFLLALAAPCAVMVFFLEWFTRRVYASELMSSRDVEEVDGVVARLSNPRLGRWMFGISLAVLAGFLTHHLTGMPAAVPALIGAATALVVQDVLWVREHRATSQERLHGVLQVTENDIEWPTLAFFGCLFIVVGAAVDTGLIAQLADGLRWTIDSASRALHLDARGTLTLAALFICWFSGVASALIDNIPFVAVSIPIVHQLTQSLPGETRALWWALALGACLGGNGTAIGASANVTTIGLAERAGVTIRFKDFTRFGAPLTIGTLLVSTIFLVSYVWLGPTSTLLVFVATAGALAAWRLLRRGPGPVASAN